MKSAWEQVKIKRPYVYCNGCAAQGFNLLMKDIMNISRRADVRDDSKSVAKFVRARHGLLDRFRSQQKAIIENGDKRMGLSVPIPTRWYTVERCIRSVSNNQSVIRSTFADTQLLKRFNTRAQRPELERVVAIVGDQGRWNESERALGLLAPINKSLAVCESDDTFLSSVYSEFVSIKENPAYLKPMSGASVEERGTYAEIQREIFDLVESRREFLMSSSMRVAYLLDQTTDITKFACSSDPNEEGDLALAMRELVDMAKGAATDPDVRFTWAERGTAPTTIPMSPSSFWKIHRRAALPLLKPVADMMFAIPTSSASSERCWSIHGFIHSKRRNRLHASKVEQLVFIYSNLASSTGEPIRDDLADDMYPDAHDGDLDGQDDERIDDDEDSDEIMQAMSDIG
ncbi:hypothetical protein L914_02057 [Phytophthora nicotianae]|uniref:HAT C-terminal dimerisation domain-containing protein n=1 Tax=Phytophthora nicotianae TaxID=4792 RepID=W2P1D9_PHYNI|nr:hypothetical protein L914_02057 [Phytophthora nicotianae]